MGCVCDKHLPDTSPTPEPSRSSAKLTDIELGHVRAASRSRVVEAGASSTASSDSKLIGDDVHYEDIQCLVTIPFFDNLDNKNLKELRSFFQRRTYEAGAVITAEGKAPNVFHVIISGAVGLTARDGANREVELSTLHKGQWFGEVALVEKSVQVVTARAREESVILSLPFEQYENAVKKHPALRVSVSSFGKMPPITVQLKKIPFFSEVPDVKLQMLAALVEFRKCGAGEVLCRQGDVADGFYYIVEGRVNVSATGPDGSQVHLDTLVGNLDGMNNFFGEIALLQNTLRTATIISTQPCVLLYLDRERFNRFLSVAPEIQDSGVFQRFMLKRTANSLKAIPLFSIFRKKELGPLQQFNEAKLALLGELFKFVPFAEGDIVYAEGDDADAFYIIVSGQCKITATAPDGQSIAMGLLGLNDWFGELALMEKGSKRNSTVSCLSPCVMLKLRGENFSKFLQLAPEFEQYFKSLLNVRTAARLRDIPFFAGIKENKPWSKLDLLGALFVFEEYPAGHVVFEEASKGDKFYVIIDGVCDVKVQRGTKGEIIIDKLKKGQWFGEIALMQNTPRTASIICETPCVFISLTAVKFQSFLSIAPELAEPFKALVSHRTANVLRSIDLFQSVKENKPWSKLELLGTLFYYEQFEAGATVCKVGDEAKTFYLIVRGRVRVTGRNDAGEDVDLAELGPQQHFGEISLLRNRPHNTTVICLEPCVFLCLTKAAFQQFMKVAPELRPYFQQLVDGRRQSTVVEIEPLDVEYVREESLSSMDINRRYESKDDDEEAA